VHDPFDKKTGWPGKLGPVKNAGQNIVCVCARTWAGYPIANKPVMPKDTARLESLGTVRRMACLRFAGNDYNIFGNVWLYGYNTSKKSTDTEKRAPCEGAIS
jgi:hypothetical protein